MREVNRPGRSYSAQQVNLSGYTYKRLTGFSQDLVCPQAIPFSLEGPRCAQAEALRQTIVLGDATGG